jgi:polyisoprenoid-binding protein YceI
MKHSMLILATLLLAFEAHAKVTFLAKGRPAILKVQGEIPLESHHYNQEKNRIDLPLDKITTGIDLRDDHLKNKYLEVAKFPTASLELLDQLEAIKKTGKFKANFTLHGVTQEVMGEASIKDASEGLSVEAKFNFQLTRFNVEVPSYQGITMADEVAVNAHFTIAK